MNRTKNPIRPMPLHPTAKSTEDHDLNTTAVHEAGHALLISLHVRNSVEVALFANTDDNLDTRETKTVLGQVRWRPGSRKMGKIYNAAVGLAGVCAESICSGEEPEIDEITGSIASGRLSDTDAAPCRGLTERELESAVEVAVDAIRKHKTQLQKLVRTLKLAYSKENSVRIVWDANARRGKKSKTAAS